MQQKLHLKLITLLQNILLGGSLLILTILPIALAYSKDSLPENFMDSVFFISLFSALLVMSIRPLSNLLPKIRILASLVILRKGLGVFSASFIVAIMLSQFMTSGWDYIAKFATSDYWSLSRSLYLARIGDITAVLLLITSNNFSKRILKRNWKRLQRLSYAYFYAGGLYEIFAFHNTFAPIALTVVTILVLLAFFKNRHKKKRSLSTQKA